MNLVQAEINSGIRGPFKLNQLDRNDPVERVMYDNRRLEAAASQPTQRVKLRKRASVVTTEEKRFLCGQ